MHKLTEKLLAAGVIPAQAVGLLKLWNSLPDDMPEDVKQARTQDELLRLVDEMAETLEQEEEIPELRETDLDIEATRKNASYVSIDVNVGSMQQLSINCCLGRTIDGKFVYFVAPGDRAALAASRGNIIRDGEVKYMITSVEPRYVDEELKYYVLTVEDMLSA